jgi:hypothetical protein
MLKYCPIALPVYVCIWHYCYNSKTLNKSPPVLLNKK